MKRVSDSYRIISQCICEVLCSFVSDFIIGENQYGECLCEKSVDRDLRDMNKKRVTVTLLFRNASARRCAPSSPILFLERLSAVSVCVKKCRWGCEKGEERKRLTMLFRNASPRCCAPRAPISLALRSSLVSVCMKQCRWRYERDAETTRLTMLFRTASMRCSAPSSPISLLERFSLVSDCLKKCRKGYERHEDREWRSPCYFVMHQPDVVLRELRFYFRRDRLW
jgi:hypothetical protein